VKKPPTKKYARRYRRWQEDVLITSPFVILCGLIAAVFLIYRFALVVTPIAFLGQTVISQPATGIVCSEDEKDQLDGPEPILSVDYQKRVQEQESLSLNLVKNFNLLEIDPLTRQPVGYIRTANTPIARYSYRQDPSDHFAYLHINTTKNTPKGDIPAAWLMKPVAVAPEKTYVYSFYYRSNVPVHVAAEYTAGNKQHYQKVTTLDPSKAWQQFTAHFSNTVSTANFRMDINNTAKGYVDTRDFNIHEIAPASLGKGMVSVTFDDGWQSAADKAAPLFEKYHIKTTQYIISDVAARGVSGYMNYGTIRRLREAGNEIGSHTLNHCNQTLLSSSDLTNNATKSKQMLEKEKLGPIKSFAYPLGRYNKKTQAAYEKTYPLIRSSDFGYNDRYFDETNIHSIGVLSTTSDKEFRSWLDYAKTHKVWVVLAYHKVGGSGTYNLTASKLESQLKMIKSSGLDIKLLSKAANSIRPSKD
jgi:peptidoglycan/xylan/chitin deacetylase (PgdA/CDA1 family)